MSPETRELLGVLAGTIPWIVVAVGLVWSTVAASYDRARHDRKPARRPTRAGWSAGAHLDGVRSLRPSGAGAIARERGRGSSRAVAPAGDG